MSQGTKKHDVPQCRNCETYWGAAGPTWPARSTVMVFKGLLQRVLVLQDASPLAWSCQVSKNINPVGTDPELQRSKRSREPALQKVRLKTATDDCKGLFLFLFSREERKLNMEMEKGGANLSPAASAPASRTMLLCPKHSGAGGVSFGAGSYL